MKINFCVESFSASTYCTRVELNMYIHSKDDDQFVLVLYHTEVLCEVAEHIEAGLTVLANALNDLVQRGTASGCTGYPEYWAQYGKYK